MEFQQNREVARERREIEQRYEAAQQQLAKAPCREFSRTQLRTMIIRHQVVVGMAGDEAMRAWGRPSRVNGSQYAYHWARGESSYFYIRNGCVNTVQGQWGG